MRRTTLVVSLALLAVSGAGSQGTVRDSAGIRIHEHRLTRLVPAFVVESIPMLRFNGEDSSTSASHSTAMMRMRDGRIAVAVNPPRMVIPDNATMEQRRIPPGTPPPIIEVRLYDSTGRFIRHIGQAGQGGGRGGGQFTASITALYELPESAILAAQNNYRWAALADDGRVLWAPRMSPQSAFGTFSDGSVLVGSQRVSSWAQPIGVAGYTYFPYQYAYDVVAPDREQHAAIGLISRRWLAQVGPGNGVNTPMPPSIFPVAVAPPALVSGDRVWTFEAIGWEALLYDRYGAIKAITRPPLPRRAIGAKLGDPLPYSDVLTSRVLVDNLGRLWIDGGNAVTFPLRNRVWSRDWTVIGNDGQLLGTVVMPERFHPHHISGDRILGSLRVSDDGETAVAMYRFSPVK